MIQLAKNSDTQQCQPQASTTNEASAGSTWVNNVCNGNSSVPNSNVQSKDTSGESYEEFTELLQELLEVGELEDETGTSTSKDYNILCMDLDNSSVGSPEGTTDNPAIANDKKTENASFEPNEAKNGIEILENNQNSVGESALKDQASEKSEDADTLATVADSEEKHIATISNPSVVSLSDDKLLEADTVDKEPLEISSVSTISVKEATSDPVPECEMKPVTEIDLKQIEEKVNEGSFTMVPSTEENRENQAAQETNSSNCNIHPCVSPSPNKTNKEDHDNSAPKAPSYSDNSTEQSYISKQSKENEKDIWDSSCDVIPPDKKAKTDEKSLDNGIETNGQKHDESQPHNDHLPVVKVLIVVDNKVVVCSSNQNMVNNEMKDIDKILQYIPDVSKTNSDEKNLQTNREKASSSTVTTEASVSASSTSDSSTPPVVVTSSSSSTTIVSSSSSSTLVTSASTTTLVQTTTTLVTSSTSLVPLTSTTPISLISSQPIPSLSTTIAPLASSSTLIPSTSTTVISSTTALVPLESSLGTSISTTSISSTVVSSTSTSVVVSSATSLIPSMSITTCLEKVPSITQTLVSSTTTSIPSVISPISSTSASTFTSHSVPLVHSEPSVPSVLPVPLSLAVPTAPAPRRLVPESFESSPISNISPCPAEVDKCSSESKKNHSEVKILNAKTCQSANFSSYGKSLWLRGIKRLKQQQLALKIAEIKHLVNANSIENFIDIHEKNTHLNKAYLFSQSKDLLLKADEKNESLLLHMDIPHDLNAPSSLLPEIYKDLPLPSSESDSVKPLSIEEKRKWAKTIYLKVKELMKKYTHSTFSKDVQKINLEKELNISKNDLNKVSAPWSDLQNEPKDPSAMTICNKFSDDIPSNYISESNQEGGESLPHSADIRDEKWDYPSFGQLQNYSWSTEDKMRSHSFSPHQNVSNANYSSVKRKIQETIIKKQTQFGKMGLTNVTSQSHMKDIESSMPGMAKKPKLSEDLSPESVYPAESIPKNTELNDNLNMRHISSIHFSPEDNSIISDNFLKENLEICREQSSTQPVGHIENELPLLPFPKPSHESVIKTTSTTHTIAADKSYENPHTRSDGCQFPVEPSSYYNVGINQKPSRPFQSSHPSVSHNQTNVIRPPDLHQSCHTDMFIDNRSFQQQQTAIKDFYEKSASEQRETLHMSFSHNSTFEASNNKSQYENSQQSYYSASNREFANSEEIHKMKSHYSSTSHQANLTNPHAMSSHLYRHMNKPLKANDVRYPNYQKPNYPTNPVNVKLAPAYPNRSEYMNKSEYLNRQHYTSSPLYYPEENINPTMAMKHLPDLQNPSDYGPSNIRSKDTQEILDYSKNNMQYKQNPPYQYNPIQQESKIRKEHSDFNRGNFGTLPHNQGNHNNYYNSHITENRQMMSKPDLSRDMTAYSYPKIPAHQNEISYNNPPVMLETNTGRITNHSDESMMYSESIPRISNCPDFNNSNKQLYTGASTFGQVPNRPKYDESGIYSEDKNSNYSDHYDETGLFSNDTSCQSNLSQPPLPYDMPSKTSNPEPFSPSKLIQREDSTHYNSNFSDISSDDNLQHILNETDFALSLPPISTILAMKNQMDSHDKSQELDTSEATSLTSNVTPRPFIHSSTNEKYPPSNASQQKDLSSAYPNYNQFKSDDNFSHSQGNQLNSSFSGGSDLSESSKFRGSNFFTSSNSNNSGHSWHNKITYHDSVKPDKQSDALNYLEMQKRNYQNDKEVMQWEHDWQPSTTMSTLHSFPSKPKNTMDYQSMGYYTSTEESPLPMMNPFSKRMFEKQERFNALQNVKSSQLYAKKKEAHKYFTNVLPVKRKRGRPRKIRTDDCLYPSQKSISKRQKREKPSSWMQHLLNFSSNFILEQKLKEEMGKKKRRHSVKSLSNYPRDWHIPPLQIPQHFYFANNKHSQNNSTPQNIPEKQEVSQTSEPIKKTIFGSTNNPNPPRDIFSKTNDAVFTTHPEKNSLPNVVAEKTDNYENYKASRNSHYNLPTYKIIGKEDSKQDSAHELSDDSESDHSLSSGDSPSSSYSSSSEYSDNDNTYQIIHPEQTEQTGKNQFHLNKIIIRKVSRTVPKPTDVQNKNVTKKEQIKTRDKVHIEVERKESGTNQFSSVIDMHIEAETVDSSSKKVKKCIHSGEMVSRVMKEGRSISVRVGLSSNIDTKDKFPKESFEKVTLEREKKAIINENILPMDTSENIAKKMETSVNEKEKSKAKAVFSSQSKENSETNGERSPLLSSDEVLKKHIFRPLASPCNTFDNNDNTDGQNNVTNLNNAEGNKDTNLHLKSKETEEKYLNKQSLESTDNTGEVSRYSSEGYKYRVVVEFKDTIAETILEQSINIDKQNDSQGANIPKIKIDVTKTKHVMESLVKQPTRVKDQVSEPLNNQDISDDLVNKNNCEMVIQETMKSAEIKMKQWASSENLTTISASPSESSHYLLNQEQMIKQSQIKDCTVRLQRVDSLIENGSVNMKLFSQDAPNTCINNAFPSSNPTEYLKQSKRKLTFMMKRKTLSLNKNNVNEGSETVTKLHDYKKDTEYNCPICNLKTKDILQILLHITKHGFALPKICPICYKSFPSEVLSCHIHCQHSRTNQGNACQMCGELLDGLSNLQEHLHIIHLRCMFCGIMRMKKAALYNHIITSHVPEIKKVESLHQEKTGNQDFLENISGNNYHVLTEWLASSSSDLSDDCESGSDSPSDWGNNSRKRILTRKCSQLASNFQSLRTTGDRADEALETSSSQSDKSTVKEELPIVGDSGSESELLLTQSDEISLSPYHQENNVKNSDFYKNSSSEVCLNNFKEKTPEENSQEDKDEQDVKELTSSNVDVEITDATAQKDENDKKEDNNDKCSSNDQSISRDIITNQSDKDDKKNKPLIEEETNSNDVLSQNSDHCENDDKKNNCLSKEPIGSNDISSQKSEINAKEDTMQKFPSEEQTNSNNTTSLQSEISKIDNIKPEDQINSNNASSEQGEDANGSLETNKASSDNHQKIEEIKIYEKDDCPTETSETDSSSKDNQKTSADPITIKKDCTPKVNEKDSSSKEHQNTNSEPILTQNDCTTKTSETDSSNKEENVIKPDPVLTKQDSKSKTNEAESSSKEEQSKKEDTIPTKKESKSKTIEAYSSSKDQQSKKDSKSKTIETDSTNKDRHSKKDSKLNTIEADSSSKDQQSKKEDIIPTKKDCSTKGNDTDSLSKEQQSSKQDTTQTKKDCTIKTSEIDSPSKQKNLKQELAPTKKDCSTKTPETDSSSKEQTIKREPAPTKKDSKRKAPETESSKEQSTKQEMTSTKKECKTKTSEVDSSSKEQDTKQEPVTTKKECKTKTNETDSSSKEQTSKQEQISTKKECKTKTNETDSSSKEENTKQEPITTKKEYKTKASETDSLSKEQNTKQELITTKKECKTKASEADSSSKEQNTKQEPITTKKDCKTRASEIDSSSKEQNVKQEPITKKSCKSKTSETDSLNKEQNTKREQIQTKKDCTTKTTEKDLLSKDQSSKREPTPKKDCTRTNETDSQSKEQQSTKREPVPTKRSSSSKAEESPLGKDQQSSKLSTPPSKRSCNVKNVKASGSSKEELEFKVDSKLVTKDNLLKAEDSSLSKNHPVSKQNPTSQKKDSGSKSKKQSTSGKNKESVKEKHCLKKDSSCKKDEIPKSGKNVQNSRNKSSQKGDVKCKALKVMVERLIDAEVKPKN